MLLYYHCIITVRSYLIFLFVACVFNGGAYYIEVFSSRYNNKFKKET